MNENKSVGNEIFEIARRIKELREITGVSISELSEHLGIDEDAYMSYESGKKDIPIGIIYGVARYMGVDSTTLLTGDGARMTDYTVVRNGHGISIERYPGYSFSSLAINYIGRDMDPMIVTLSDGDTPAALVRHGGQEFNYVIEGSVTVTIGEKSITLNEGDSIYFNPSLPHGQKAASPVARFLTVINE